MENSEIQIKEENLSDDDENPINFNSPSVSNIPIEPNYVNFHYLNQGICISVPKECLQQ